jgi:hypothetical protein
LQKIGWAPWHGLRNPIFPKNRISWAGGFLCHFLGMFGHGLRNPIFAKNWLGTLARFEKSDFSKKSDFLGTLARFEKSDFSKKSDFLGTFWVVWKLPLSCTRF